MNIVKVCAFCMIAVILILTVKEHNKSIAVLLSLVASIGVLLYVIANMQSVFDILETLVNKSKVESKYLLLILKVAGISYLVEFGKNVCCDSGESALGTKLELAGKLTIVTLTIPILSEMLEIVINLI